MKVETTREAVERIAAYYAGEARHLDVAEAIGDADTALYARSCQRTAATMRALAAERDAAVARAEAAEKERDDWRTTAGATHITLTMERNNAIAQRDAARAALKEWPDAYSAFLGAFDTPIARRRDSCDFATDARHRMAAFNEIARAALASGEKA